MKLVLLAAFLGLVAVVSGQEPTALPVETTARHHHGGYRTVCYMAGWGAKRRDPVQFEPEDMDTNLCSHLIFAFIGIDDTGLQLQPVDSHDTELYRRVTGLKRERHNLKVMLSVGGSTAGSAGFMKTVSTPSNMHAFAANTIEFLHSYGFDGLDVDWEFPAHRGSPPADKQRFTQLIKTLKYDFNEDYHMTKRPHLTLSVAISPSPSIVNSAYELENITQNVDFYNVMTYDLHGESDHMVGHHSALYSPTDDETDSIDYLIQWILHNKAVPAQKINLGLSFYGRTFNLTDPSNTQLGAPVTGAGQGGDLVGEKGVMMYYEICRLLTEHNDTVTASGRLPNSMAPYVVDGNRWTGYDDTASIRQKVDYAVQQGLGGVAIWSIDLDDFHGLCGGGHYPLMNAIKMQYHQSIIG